MGTTVVDFDALIINAINAGCKTNRAIRTALGFSPREYSPAVDKTLQRLRKAHKIYPDGKVWRMAGDTGPCSRCGGSGKEPANKRKARS